MNDQKIIQHAREAKPVNGCSLYTLLAVFGIAALSVLLSGKPARSEPVQTTGDLYKLLEPLGPNAQVRYNPSGVALDVSVAGGVVYFAPGVPIPGPGPQPEPEPPTPNPTTRRQPFGIAALQPGKHAPNDASFPSGGRRISLAQLQDPDISGYTLRFAPPTVAAKYAAIWQGMTECIANARKADVWYTIIPMSGGHAINAQSIASYDAIDDEIARRWLSDPLFAGYHITGVTQDASEELHWKGGMSPQNEAWMIHRMEHARQVMGPDMTLIVACGGGDDAAMRRFAAEAKRIGGRWKFKNNNLKAFHPGNNTAATWPNASHNRLLVDICKDPAIGIGEEMVDLAGNTNRSGSANINDSIKQMAVLAKMAGKKPSESYCAIYPGDTTKADAKILSP